MKIERPRHPPVSAIVCGRCYELGVGGLFRPRAPNRKLEETPMREDGGSIAGCITKEEKIDISHPPIDHGWSILPT